VYPAECPNSPRKDTKDIVSICYKKTIETRNKCRTALWNKLSSIKLTGVPTTEEIDPLVDESPSVIRETVNEVLGVQSTLW